MKLRCLLIEDDEDHREVFEFHLCKSKSDVELVHCDRFSTARKSLADGQFEFVFVDLTLPDLSASETIAQLPALRREGRRLIAMSSLVDSEIEQRALAGGADAVLAKQDLSAEALRKILMPLGDQTAEPAQAKPTIPDSAPSPVPESKDFEYWRSFASQAVHDVEGGLRAIRYRCDLLEEDCGPALAKAGAVHLDSVRHNVDRVSELIASLRKTLLETLRPVRIARVSLADLLEEIRDRFHRQIEARSGSLTFDRDAKLQGDRDQLLSLFEALIDNALKHAEAEELKIEVRVHPSEKGIEIEVADNGSGTGLAAEAISKLLDPFRIGNVLQPRQPGLGLFRARNIAESLGGTLEIRGGSDDGFSVRLGLPADPTPSD